MSIAAYHRAFGCVWQSQHVQQNDNGYVSVWMFFTSSAACHGPSRSGRKISAEFSAFAMQRSWLVTVWRRLQVTPMYWCNRRCCVEQCATEVLNAATPGVVKRIALDGSQVFECVWVRFQGTTCRESQCIRCCSLLGKGCVGDCQATSEHMLSLLKAS